MSYRPAYWKRSQNQAGRVRRSAANDAGTAGTEKEESTGKNRDFPMDFSGEAGIRTLGGVTPTPVFKTGAIGRSATSPKPSADGSSYSADTGLSTALERFRRPEVRPPMALIGDETHSDQQDGQTGFQSAVS